MVTIAMSYDDLERILIDINSATDRFPPPPQGFDPLQARPGELETYGLPPMPDQATQPELFDFWHEMHSRPLSFPSVNFDYAPTVAQNAQSAAAVQARTRYQSSRNWCGAYVTPRSGRMLIEVLGSWKVPEVAVPSGAPLDAEYGCSTWIGFDGQRRYLDSTLPQIGTGQFLNLDGVPGPTTTSWIQWWPGPPLTLPSLPVSPLDTIMCWLTVVNATQVILRIKNASASSGPYLPFLWTAPQLPMLHPPTPVQAQVSGATAEWVMERPAKWPTDELYELPDYGCVKLTGAIAKSATAPGQPSRVETLFGARLIRMYKVAEDPHRAVTISVAKRCGPHTVKTSYRA
jgi:peptidase A4-like protein